MIVCLQESFWDTSYIHSDLKIMCNSGLAVVRLENCLDFKELSQLITQKLFKHSSYKYHQHLAHCHGQWLYSRKPGEPKSCYNTAAPHWVLKTVARSGVLLLLTALNQEPRLVQREVCLFSEAVKRGVGGELMFKGQLPTPSISG